MQRMAGIALSSHLITSAWCGRGSGRRCWGGGGGEIEVQGRGGAGDDEVGRAVLLHEVVGVFQGGVFFALGGGDGAQGEAGGERGEDEGGDFLRGLVGHGQAQLVQLHDVGDGGLAILADAFFVLLQLVVGMQSGSEVNKRGGDGDDEEDEKGGRAEGRFLHTSGVVVWRGCAEGGRRVGGIVNWELRTEN